MKMNELLGEFNIQRTNEEQKVLDRCSSEAIPMYNFSERDTFILEALIRKALVSKIVKDGNILVIANEF